MQSEHGRHQRDHANHGHGQEDGTPAIGVGLPAAQGGADCRSHAHGHAHGAHSKAASGQRVDREHRDLQHRPHHARAGRLQHAAEQHEEEVRAQPGQQGADREHRHRADHDLSGGETTGQERGQRYHNAHDQLEHGGQPLARGYGNMEFRNDDRQRRAQLQLRKVADEGNKGQDCDGNKRGMTQLAVSV